MLAFRKDDILMLTKHILGLPEREMSHFYLKSKFDYNLSIKQHEFTEQYPFTKSSALVNWVPNIVSGFSRKNMNLDENQEASLTNKLTVMSEQLVKNEAQEQGLSESELEHITEFMNCEIKGREAKHIMKTFQKMFKDTKKQKLKKYMMQSVSQLHGLSF